MTSQQTFLVFIIILLYSTLDFAVFSCKLPLHNGQSTMARTGLRASAINISLVDFNRSFTFGQNRKFITMEIRFPSALGDVSVREGQAGPPVLRRRYPLLLRSHAP